MALSLVPTSVWAAPKVDPRQVDRFQYYDSAGNLITVKGNGNKVNVSTEVPFVGAFWVSDNPKTYHNNAPAGKVAYYMISDSQSNSTPRRYDAGEYTGGKYGTYAGYFNASIYMVAYYTDPPAAEVEEQTIKYKVEYRNASNQVETWGSESSYKYECQTQTSHSTTHTIKTQDFRDNVYNAASIKDGYEKVGWTTTAGGGIRSIGTGTTMSFSSNQTIYIIAKANAPAEKTYTLNFDANGGKGAPGSLTGKSSTGSCTFQIPSTVPTKDGFDFQGWSEVKDGTVVCKQNGSYTATATPTTLYAVWQQKTPQVDNPKAPDYEYLAELGDLVNLWCTTERTSTGGETLKLKTKLLEGTYSVTIDPRDPYTCTVSVNQHHEYYAVLITDKTHEIDTDTTQDQNFSLEYNKETGKWELGSDKEANLHFKCTQTSVDPIELGGGELNALFQKNLTVTQGSTMAEEAFTITLTNKEDPTQTVSGTTALMSASGVAPFTFTSGLTFDDEGDYTFIVKEDDSKKTDGMTYDKNEYRMTVEVYQDGDTLKYRTPTFTDGNGQTAALVNEKLTFNNTYDKKAPATEAVLDGAALSNLFKKDLTVNETMTDGEEFEIVVKDAQGVEVARGNTAEMKTAKTEFFKFDDSIELTFNKDESPYTYTVEEVNNGTDKMAYDSTKYTMTVTVTENNNVLTAAAGFTPENDTTATPAGMVTFKNTYGTKTTPTVPTADEVKKALGNVTVKCLNPTVGKGADCTDQVYWAAGAFSVGEPVKVTDEQYTVEIGAAAFLPAFNKHTGRQHDLYSKDTLIWVLNYENGTWVGTPQTSGEDDTILVTHAPTTYDEAKQMSLGNINTRCKLCTVGYNAMGVISAFVGDTAANNVTVVKAEDPGAYTLTINKKLFADTLINGSANWCAHAKKLKDNKTPNPDARKYDMVGSDTATFNLTVKLENGKYVWSAVPATQADGICEITHRVKVTFNENYNNTSTTDVMYKYNTAEVKEGTFPADPAREGYTFKGWNTKADGTGTAFDAKTIVTDDVTVYAQWEAKTDVSYTVKYLHKTSNAELKPAKTVTGQTFDTTVTEYAAAITGYKADAETKTLKLDAYNKELVFYYTPEVYTITYELHDKDAKHTNQTTYTVEDAFEITDATNGSFGRKFLEWRDADSATGKVVNKIEKGTTGNITLHAIWQNPVKYIIVDKDGNETLFRTEYVTVHDSCKPIDAPAHIGYDFDGWYKSTKDFGVDSKKVKDDIKGTNDKKEWKLYGRYDAIEYTITYDYRDKDIAGKADLQPQNPTSYTIESDTIILNSITAKGEFGKTFLEWRDVDGKKIEKIEKGTTGNLTIYAYWNYPVNYTVLDKDDKPIDEFGATEYFAEGESEKYTLRAAPTKDGYTFDGWYQDAGDMEKGSDFIISGLTRGDKKYELCGKLTPNTDTPYKVEHYQEQLDGSYKLVDTDENLPSTTGTTDTTVDAVEKGHVKKYDHFTYDSSVDGTVASGNIAGDGSLVLKLYYTRNSYTVTFVPDNGDENTTATVKYGAKVAKPTDPTKTGYTFDGWFADGVNTAFAFDETAITGNITLTAHWTINQYNVVFDSDGGAKLC